MVETTGGGPGDGTAEVLDRPLPDGVRRRVVQIVSDGFGGLTVTELPAQLRQYARFAPNRRAKFAGNAMAAALETDPLFRQRIGEKFREAQPELADAERADEESRAELERLRTELAHAREHTRTETERLRTELDAAKKEAES